MEFVAIVKNHYPQKRKEGEENGFIAIIIKGVTIFSDSKMISILGDPKERQ
jgi:hypothetical protein